MIYIYNEIYNIINMIWVSNYPNILESNNGKTIDYIIYIIYIYTHFFFGTLFEKPCCETGICMCAWIIIDIPIIVCLQPHNIQGGAPIVINWFIIPLTIDITPINPSYWTYKPT
jgi:hypothetical protein